MQLSVALVADKEDPMNLQQMRVGLRALEVLKSDPTDPAAGRAFVRSIEGPLHKQLADEWARHAEGRNLLATRPPLDGARVAGLAELPEGTLGRAYADYFVEKGIKPLSAWEPAGSDDEYVAERLSRTHDLWHLLTGYETDGLGELELHAFVYGNVGGGTFFFALAAGRPVLARGGRLAWQRIWRAFQRGRRSRRLDSFVWERHWNDSVALLRETLCAPCEAAS
jgi:ubiquinone biosynthesis protein COQ4